MSVLGLYVSDIVPPVLFLLCSLLGTINVKIVDPHRLSWLFTDLKKPLCRINFARKAVVFEVNIQSKV